MRIGNNPLKGKKIANLPAPVTVALLVCVPNNDQYFKQSLNVLELCLQSVYWNTTVPYELLVFDNGSSKQVVEILIREQRKGRISYLVLSEQNVGKVRALNFILGASPGEYIVYADSDVFFYPGWLEAHLEVIDTFPNVGMVTGLPMRHLVNFETSKTLMFAEQTQGFTIEKGHLISEEIIRDFCDGVGLDVNEYLSKYREMQDIKLDYGGVRAYVGASHFQFLCSKKTVGRCLPLNVDESTTFVGRSERQLDERINEEGLLRLSTANRYVHHLGNFLTKDWNQIAKEYSQKTRKHLGKIEWHGP